MFGNFLSSWVQGNELEASVRGKIDIVPFNNVLAHLRREHGDLELQDEVLDVMFGGGSNVRLSVRGKEAISQYCRDPAMTNPRISMMEKERLKVNETPGIRTLVKLSRETATRNRPTTAPTRYRLKRRCSIKSHDNLARFDLTIVKESSTIDFRRVPESREIEMEYIGPADVAKAAATASALESYWKNMLKVFFDDPELTPFDLKRTVLDQYLRLDIFKEVNNISDVRGAILDHVIKSLEGGHARGMSVRRYFVGPQPVTLERDNLRHIVANDIPYSMTQKADGERVLVFVHGARIYHINNRLDVKATGLTAASQFNNHLFDAELVGTRLFLFDTLYKGKMLQDETLVARLGLAQAFVKAVKSDKVQVKHFALDPVLAKNMAEISQTPVPFETDGYILTPINDPYELKGTTLMLKNPILKFKPPDQNSIDFMVRFVKDAAGAPIVTKLDGMDYKTVTLYVGSGPTTAKEYFKYRLDKVKYFAKEFEFGPSRAEVKANCKCENGDIIREEDVVEMAYRGDMGDSRWVPMRVRHDKTYDAKTSNTVTANNIVSAQNVWRSIVDPVTEDMLRDKSALLETGLNADRRYYVASTGVRGKLAIGHNRFIKDAYTIKRLATEFRCSSLLDVACGKGGDIHKWLMANYKCVVGLDVCEDNLVNPENGAYKRLSEAKMDFNKRYAFLPMDTSNDIIASIDAIEDPFMRQLGKCIWPAQIDKQACPPSIRHLHALENFDVISCQFALHYFFRTEAHLRGLLANAAKMVKSGGYFVCTYFDGDTVDERLRGVADIKSQTWRVTRKYDTYDPRSFGQKIRVFISSIGKEHEEYLVPQSLLEDVAQEFGFKILETRMFGEIYGLVADGKKHYNALTADEKELDSLYRWSMFVKN